MRRSWTWDFRRARFVVALAVACVVTSAAASPIGSTVNSPQVAPAATADCSEATARQLVEQHDLNSFLLPNPVRQVLCGPFTGAGSETMAVTIGAPTCWPVQRWAVFRFTGGAWQLVLDQPAYLVPPLAAVGSDIRETTAVSRPGDTRCDPTGGTHARLWHWDGSRLVPGPWKQVTKGEAMPRQFYSPSRNLFCVMGDDNQSHRVNCWSYKAPEVVKMNVNGALKICRGRRCFFDCGCREEAPILAYGRQVTVGRFRCLSLQTGVKCTVIQSGKGFLISRDAIRRIP